MRAQRKAKSMLSKLLSYDDWIKSRPNATPYEKETYYLIKAQLENIAKHGQITEIEQTLKNGIITLKEKWNKNGKITTKIKTHKL